METLNDSGPAIEVVARPERRRFTREYKQRVLAETDACPAGEIGAVLRRDQANPRIRPARVVYGNSLLGPSERYTVTFGYSGDKSTEVTPG